MDYVDIETLEAYGGWKNPSEEDRALLQHFISAASAFIDTKLGRTFGIPDGQAATAHTFTADNELLLSGRTLWLDDDLCSVPTFAEDPAPTVTLIPTTAPYNRIVRESGIWPDPTVVTGHWAYSMTPPAPIVQLTLRLAKWFYMMRESTDSDRPIVTSAGMVIMPSSLPKDIQDIFDLFTKARLP
jgi:hypothetical protein